jgi:hypothetical protein
MKLILFAFIVTFAVLVDCGHEYASPGGSAGPTSAPTPSTPEWLPTPCNGNVCKRPTPTPKPTKTPKEKE